MHVLATREALLRQFAALRSQAVADQDDDVSHHTRASRHTGTRERSGGSGSGGSEHARRVRERLEAVQRVPLMDSLLPCGSVLVSAPAVAHLIRQLSESGHHYRALKLSAAIVRASRLLCRAARLPAPHVVKQERVVYRHVRSRKTQRKVVVKERVPVFRVVGGVSTMDVDGSGGGGGDAHARGEEALAALALGGEQSVAHAASSAVKPVGMLYQVEGAVVEEMVRVGLRMGAAGWKLADGVRDECFQGAVVDYTTGRGLPVPSEEQVAQFVRQPLSASSGVDASLVVVVGGVAHALLELVGLAQRHGRRQGGGLLPAPPLGANNEQALQPVRVPPSPLLLEIAQTHTDSSDVDRHRRYRAEFLQDAGRFSTLGNLIAMQFSTMLRNPLHAVQAMHCVWVAATATVLSTPSRGTVRGTGAGGGGTQGVEWLDARPFISLPGAEPTFTSLSVSASPSTLSALAEMRWLDQTRRQLQREVEADRGTVRALVSLTADEEGDEDYNRGATLASSPRTLSEVKSFLSGSQRDGGLTEGTSPSSVTGTSSSRSRRGGGRERSSTTSRDVMARRHEALVYHCWFSPTAASSSLRQQRERLWGLCAATLLGLSPDVGFGTHHVAQWSTAVLRNTIAAAAGVVLTPTPSARDEAAPSFDAAGTLTPPQRVLLHNTVRALLLSPFFSSTPTLRRDGDAEGERWRVLSSGYTPAVHSVHEFLHVQLHLWQELQRAGGAAGDEKDEDDEMVPRASTPVTAMVGRPSAEAVFVRELSAVLHGAAMASTHPAWQLYKRLLQNPVLAHWWLRHTLFDPSPELLLWIASAVPSTDCRREEVDVQSVTAIEGWARQLLTQPSSGTPTQDAAAVEEVAAMMQRALQRVPATRLPQRQRI